MFSTHVLFPLQALTLHGAALHDFLRNASKRWFIFSGSLSKDLSPPHEKEVRGVGVLRGQPVTQYGKYPHAYAEGCLTQLL